METPETFGQWLRRARKRRGLSQQALGERADIDRTYVLRLEKDSTALPRKETRDKLHSALETSDQDLLDAGVFHIDPRTEEEIAGPAPTIVKPATATGRADALTPILMIGNIAPGERSPAGEFLVVSDEVQQLIKKMIQVDWTEDRIGIMNYSLDGMLEYDRQRRGSHK